MSLLNNMLRDLEQRRGRSASDAAPELSDLRAPPEQHRQRLSAIVIGVLAVAVCLLILSLLWMGSRPSETPATPTDPPLAANAPATGGQPASTQTPTTEQSTDRAPMAQRSQTTTSVVQIPPVAEPTRSIVVRARPAPQFLAFEAATANTDNASPATSTAALPAEPPDLREQSASRSPEGDSAAAVADTAESPPRMSARRETQSVEVARTLWRNGDRQNAIEALEQHIANSAHALSARELLADWYVQTGQSTRAISQLQAILEQAPDHLSARQRLARTLQQQGDAQAAIRTLSAHRGELPGAEWLLLGALYQQTEQPQAAAAAYRQALSLLPDSGRGWAGLAIALEQVGEPAAAATAWQRALQQPTLPEPLRRYGRQRLNALQNQSFGTGQQP